MKLLSQGLYYSCFLQADSRLVIYDSLDCRNYQVPSQPVTGSGAVRTFFCISRGIVQVTCRLESFMDLFLFHSYPPSLPPSLSISRLQQSSYSHSSSIIVGLDIKNDSSVDVSGYTVNASSLFLSLKPLLIHPPPLPLPLSPLSHILQLLRVIKLLALDRMRDEEELTPHTILSTILTSEGQGCPHNDTVSQ